MKNKPSCKHTGICSNSKEVFITFLGHTLKGVIFCEPVTSAVTLLFDCGWGLVVNNNGAHWVLDKEEADSILKRRKKELEIAAKEIQEVIDLAERKRK